MSTKKKSGRTLPHPGRRVERPWVPMQPGVRTPMQPHVKERLMAKGMTEEQLLELEQEEIWVNDLYVASCTRREDGSVYELSIRRRDRQPAHDWRDFQRIKNEVAGWDVEAVELYPSMARVMDTANQYYLWCMPPGVEVPAGFNFPGPNLTDAEEHNGMPSQQRPLPEDWKEYAREHAAQ